MSTNARAEGPGSIAVGGDAINSIFVTGGVNHFFVGQYERLADAYLNPRALFLQLRLDEYGGRSWLVRTVDHFIAGNECGYVVIEGEAGMGKTAFLAWLARSRGYIHHFVRLMVDPNDVAVAMRNLSAQLLTAWDLKTFAVGGVLTPAASRPDFFFDVLFEAAAKRDVERPGEPIVIVVDGLNETNPLHGRNPFGLPEQLPAGVYIVVSQRTNHVPLVTTTPRCVITMRADSSENLGDMREFLASAVGDDVLAARLAAAGVASGDFVEQVLARCAGVWLMLRYVLDEVRSGALRVDDVASLPVGLWQYYAQFWRGWQDGHERTWAATDEPLLATLAAAREPLTADELCTLGGCAEPDRAAALLADEWRPFLQVVEDVDGVDERYAPFHDSLREFVAGHVEAGRLASAERSYVTRLATATRTAHLRIADHYLTAWGGLDEGLPALRNPTATDDYGFHYVVHHLAAAGADDVLHRLLELEWVLGDRDGTVVNAWFEAHRLRRAFAAYGRDIEQAWSRSEQSPDGKRMDRTLRYALMAASINSVVGNVPVDLLLALIDDGQLTAGQALEMAQEITEPRRRSEALTRLAAGLTGAQREGAVREALASIQLIPDGYWRAGELVRIAPIAAADHFDDLVLIASTIRWPYDRDIVRRTLGLPTELDDRTISASSLDPSDPAAFRAQYLERTQQGTRTLLAGLEAKPGTEATDLVDATAFVHDTRWRAELLTASAPPAGHVGRADVLSIALGVSFTIGDEDALDRVLAVLAHDGIPRTAELDAEQSAARDDPAAFADAEQRDAATAALARRLVRNGDVAEATELLSTIADPHWRDATRFEVAMELVSSGRHDEALGYSRDLPMAPRAEVLATTGRVDEAVALADAALDAAERIAIILRIRSATATAPAGRDLLTEAGGALADLDDAAARPAIVAVALALAADDRHAAAVDLARTVRAADRPDVLYRLGPHLDGESAAAARSLALELRGEIDRGRVLAALTQPLSTTGTTDLGRHVAEALHLLATGTRADLTTELPHLIPGLSAVDGDRALRDVAAAIRTARRWWP